MRKVKITQKGKKKESQPPVSKQFQFPLISKLRGKRKFPFPEGGDGGGGAGGGDGGFSPRVDSNNPGQFLASSGGFLSSTFNDFIPAHGRPIPRYVDGPSEVNGQHAPSESESNDDEVSNYFRQRRRQAGTSSLTSGFSTISSISSISSDSLQPIYSKKQVSLPQLQIQERSTTLPRIPASASQYGRTTPPTGRPWKAAVLERAASEGLITQQENGRPIPKQFSARPPLPYFHPPEQQAPPSLVPKQPIRIRPDQLPPSMIQSSRGPSPAGISTSKSKSRHSVRPAIEFSFEPKLTNQKRLDENLDTSRREPAIVEPRARQRQLKPPKPIKIPARSDLISDGSSVEEVYRRSTEAFEENILDPSFFKIPTHPREKEDGDSLADTKPRRDPALAFISPIVRKSIRAQYSEIQPRYTEEPLFWVKPECEEGLFGPDGLPVRVWPPDSQTKPPSDFLLQNAIKAVREPTKVPVPKYLDSSTGKVKNWSESGLARNYVYKPDFGKVPAYIASPRKPQGPINQSKFNSIMNLQQQF